MKILSKKQELCIACGACEEVCSKTYFKEKASEKSCITIESSKEEKINVCNQCGVCIDICPVKAISRNTLGVVTIKKKDCVGCFMCVGFCPEEAMRQHDDYVEPFKCIACGLCVHACPTGAIFIGEVEGQEAEMLEQIAASGGNL